MSLRKDPSSVRIRDVLLEMRRYRTGLIQTADQLRFSYLAIIEGAKYIKGDTSVQASPSSRFCSVLLMHKFYLVCLFFIKCYTNIHLLYFYVWRAMRVTLPASEFKLLFYCCCCCFLLLYWTLVQSFSLSAL